MNVALSTYRAQGESDFNAGKKDPVLYANPEKAGELYRLGWQMARRAKEWSATTPPETLPEPKKTVPTPPPVKVTPPDPIPKPQPKPIAPRPSKPKPATEQLGFDL